MTLDVIVFDTFASVWRIKRQLGSPFYSRVPAKVCMFGHYDPKYGAYLGNWFHKFPLSAIDKCQLLPPIKKPLGS